MIRKRELQPVEEIGVRPNATIEAGPPGYWSSHFVLELEDAISLASKTRGAPAEKVTSAGHLLYLHYIDRQEWFDAERVITSVVDLPGAGRRVKGDNPFDLVNVLHAIHLSLWGRNELGGHSAFARVGPRASIQRTQLAQGAKAAIALASGDFGSAVLMAEKAKRGLTRRKDLSAIDRLVLSWWEEVVARANASLRPRPLSAGTASPPLASRLTAFPFERTLSTPIGDRFAWDPGVPSDFRAEWILRRRPVIDLTG